MIRIVHNAGEMQDRLWAFVGGQCIGVFNRAATDKTLFTREYGNPEWWSRASDDVDVTDRVEAVEMNDTAIASLRVKGAPPSRPYTVSEMETRPGVYFSPTHCYGRTRFVRVAQRWLYQGWGCGPDQLDVGSPLVMWEPYYEAPGETLTIVKKG